MMKKILVLCLFIALILLVNCGNEPYEGDLPTRDNPCELAIEATANAAEDFSAATEDQYNLLCSVYKDALQDQISLCGDPDGLLQNIIDELGDCVLENPLCDDAIAATEVARQNYLLASDSDTEALCNAYKDALEYQIEVCGDDGTLRAILDELGDCEPVFVETVGTWRLEAWLTDQARDIDNDGEVTNDYLEDIDCYTNETITFYSDGTGVLYLRSVADITYTPIDGSPNEEDFFVTCNAISIDRPFNWVQIGNNTLIFTMEDGSIVNYFRNSNSLFIAIDNAFSATSTVDGVSQINERITYVYVKL
ncbi:hypothetical protein [Winogradskyella sp. PG-2]|uniref:hypothetical protein n=1 Tax=Winogradskyella sp. PG-2 TaxID=754409 RepID=UPI000458925D|nr:hypothetical protein [Winogradskyella sp. PG-2]BAO77129.1 hypothetical protein WPG_2899 [Winogradskyella sp. PG-2]